MSGFIPIFSNDLILFKASKMTLNLVTSNVNGGIKYIQPDELSGLRVWLDAKDPTTIETSTDFRMNDKSGNGNHFQMLAAYPDYQPLYNGVDTVTFDGVNDYLNCYESDLKTIAQPCTIIVVSTLDGRSGYYPVFDGAVSTSTRLALGNTNFGLNEGIYSGNFVESTSVNLNMAIRMGEFNTSSSKYFRDNQLIRTGDSGAGNLSNGMRIAVDHDLSSGRSAIDLHEVIIYDRILNDSEKLKIFRSLANKWGLSLYEEDPSNTIVFLIAGQSNAVGWAIDNYSYNYPNNTIQYGKNSSEYMAAGDPLDHWNEQERSMGFARQFAIDYITNNPTKRILFIPAAEGGTGFSANEWNPGDRLYEYAKDTVNTVMSQNPQYTFGGVLWHQGEDDYLSPAGYVSKFYKMIQWMRDEITVADDTTPFIVGEIKSTSAKYNATIDQNINNVPDYFPATAVVSTEDQTLFDTVHFSADSYDVIGGRYYSALVSSASNVRVSAEAGASNHWLIGADNQKYFDLVNYDQASENDSALIHSEGYSIIQSNNDGLTTSFQETEAITMCFVVYHTAQDSIIGGTIGQSGVYSDGISPYFQSGDLLFNERGGAGSQIIESTAPTSSWLFVAVSLNANDEWVGFRGDATTSVTVSGTSGGRNASTRNCSIGDVHYNDAVNFADSLQVAEAIFFNSYKTTEQLESIYLNSKTRLATRNITVV